jgi:hypothetical protein
MDTPLSLPFSLILPFPYFIIISFKKGSLINIKGKVGGKNEEK